MVEKRNVKNGFWDFVEEEERIEKVFFVFFILINFSKMMRK